MKFFLELGDEAKNICDKINYRRACKAIIYDNIGRLIMIRTRDGSFKFPGGGMKEGENDLQTLQREIREELGIDGAEILDAAGIVIEKKQTPDEENNFFIMESVYYFCSVNFSQICDTELEKYEKEEDFQMYSVSLEGAIQENESRLCEGQSQNWTLRETMVLKALREWEGTPGK